MIKQWIGFVFTLIVLFASAVPAAAQDDAGDVPLAPLVIDTATVEDLTGDNPVLIVEGSLGTGCDLPVVVEQTQDGGTLTVWLYQDVDAATICPAILVPYSDTIPLEIDPAGSVTTVIVNGQQTPIGGDESGDDPWLPIVESVRFEAIPQDGSQAVTLWQLVVTCAEGEPCNGSPSVFQQMRPGHIVVTFVPGTSSGTELIIPLEEPVTLNEAWADNPFFAGGVIVEVNDFIGVASAGETITLEPADGGDSFTAVNTFDVRGPDGEQIIPTERKPLTIDDITIDIDPDEQGLVTLNITATQTDGCDVPVLATQRDFRRGDFEFWVDVYTPQPLALGACPAVMITHEVEFTLAGWGNYGRVSPGTYSVFVNGAAVGLTVFPARADGGEPVVEVEHVIESVTVEIAESFPPQLFVRVEGYQTDGCETAVIVEQVSNDDTFVVRIYRELPITVTCPQQIIAYNENIALGPVQPGTYTIIVNDVTQTVEVD